MAGLGQRRHPDTQERLDFCGSKQESLRTFELFQLEGQRCVRAAVKRRRDERFVLIGRLASAAIKIIADYEEEDPESESGGGG